MSENLIGATTAIFTVSLSNAATDPVDVQWATRDGSAIGGTDYKPAEGLVTFLPGETEKQIEVLVYGQHVTPADDKVFFINLSPPSNAVLVDALLTCRIVVDDLGEVPVTSIVVAEGRRGPKGAPGLSAYELAVYMGEFTGTLDEWMEKEANAARAAERAEVAAVAANIGSKVYATAAAGVHPSTGVPNGAYYNVRSSLSKHYVDEYQNVNGNAVATGKSYPSAKGIEDAQALAEKSAAIAEAAATAANIGGKVYPTPEAGVDPVTGVGNGAYYNVRSPDNDSFLVEYQNIGGVPTPSGKSYPSSAAVQALDNEVKDLSSNTTYFYATVAAMVSDTKLKDGMIVGTKGYSNIFDDGGAIYLISSTATNYSIPLENGLHAVFRDTFDIRKFGIVSSSTLDQTENIRRMIAYADSREYVIDFHNFHIMTPDIVQYTSTRGTIFRGMGFNYVHDIQNIRPCNNKTIPLYQGTTPLMFLPKRKGDGVETFKLTNVRLDLFVNDVVKVSGEGDGRFHGFYAGWHPDYPVASPTNLQSESGYNFETDGIYADTAGRTSTMALNLWFNDIKFKNMFGEYIGYYTTHFGTRVTGENVHTVFRDDIYAATGAGMVSNTLQEEQEVGSDTFVYTQEYQRFKNMSCHKYTDGSEHTVIKRQVMGTPTIKEWRCENIKGAVAVNTAAQNLTVNSFELTDVSKINRLYCRVLEFRAKNSPLTGLIENSSRNQTSLFEFTKCTINADLFYDTTVIDKVTFDECIFNSSFARRALAKIKEVVINGGETRVWRLFEGDFEVVNINNTKISGTAATDSFIYKRGSNWTNSSVSFNFVPCARTPTLLASLDTSLTATQALNVSVRFSSFPSSPTYRLGLGSLNYINSSPSIQGSKTYDPALIAPGAIEETTVTVPGIRVGDMVEVMFSQQEDNILIFKKVSADNTVTVKFKNIGSTAIDLPGGTLTAKKI